jgi:hypothetical protein
MTIQEYAVQRVQENPELVTGLLDSDITVARTNLEAAQADLATAQSQCQARINDTQTKLQELVDFKAQILPEAPVDQSQPETQG